MQKKCHFIGIGGIGMSGLAKILLSKHVEVSGSDLTSSAITEGLSCLGAKVHLGHSAEHVPSDATVIYSTDIKTDNPEFATAKRLKCAMIHRSDLLLQLTTGHKTLAVTGTHGKTTTTALLTSALIAAKKDPSYAVGGVLNQLHTNAGHGRGEYFVAEADESDGTFLKYRPFGAIVTNIDFDHMNHFETEENLVGAFKTFVMQVTSLKHLFWCGDDQRLVSLKLPGISYGFGSKCALRATRMHQKGWQLVFDAEFQGKKYREICVNLIGKHNVMNALAVFGLGLSLGIDEATLRHTLETFSGVGRRCEKKGDLQRVLLLDDYAHHPTEIRTTLEGIREAIGERRLMVVFQPHRFTRTKDCLGTYGGIFDLADELFVTEIYSAGEQPIPGVTNEAVFSELKSKVTMPLHYVARNVLAETLARALRPHDVVVTLGAGDITKLGGEIINHLGKKPVRKLRVGLICGGRSVEHEVSLNSVKYFKEGLKQDCYEVSQFGITKEGRWIHGAQAIDTLRNASEQLDVKLESNELFTPQILKELLECDVLFPVLHGSYGEDGTIQGLFEMLDKAYVGCDHRADSVCMDKVLTKIVVAAAGVNIVPYVSFSQYEWQAHHASIIDRIHKQLKYPLFVKPTHLGSSIAVKKVNNDLELELAVVAGLRVDTHIIVENGIHCRELEFAVSGHDQITVYPPAEVCTGGKVLDYRGKYGAHAMHIEPIANVSLALQELGMQLAEKAYKAAGCSGLARVDFFLDDKENYWFNEINPFPGFTATSQYPIVCEAHGITKANLVDRLTIMALQRKRQQGRLTVHV